MRTLNSLKYFGLGLRRCYSKTSNTNESALINAAIRRKRCEIFDEELAKQRSLITRVEKIEVNVKGPPMECTLLMNKDISTPYNCAMHINELVTKQSALARVDGQLWDMHLPLTDNCTLEFLHFKQEDPTELNKVFWRSCSFLLGMLAERAFKEDYYVELHSWPVTNVRCGCFMYDVDLKMENWTPNKSDLQVMSTVMKRLTTEDHRFQRLEVKTDIALKMFEDNRYKTQQIPDIALKSKEDKVILYRLDDHIDISRGPMIGNVNQVNKFTVSAVHPMKIEGRDMYRFQGVALPAQIMLNSYAFGVLIKRASKLQKFIYESSSDFENDVVGRDSSGEQIQYIN